MPPNPLVSVLMPAYNCERFIREAIQAILNQSFIDFEFLIINDGSTDDTRKIILSFLDERIRFFENDVNCGITRTLNRGLSLAKGRYILRTDADDVAVKDMLQSLVNFMETNDDYIVCGANMKLINGDKFFFYPSEDEELKVHTLSSCPFSHSTVIFRKEVLNSRALFYNEEIKDGEDHGLWSELLPFGKFKNLKIITLLYRESESQITSNKDYGVNYINARQLIFSIHAKKYFSLKEDEVNDYIALIMRKQVNSMKDLERIGQVLLTVLNVNQRVNLFKQSLLKKFLIIKWHWLCWDAYFLGRNVFLIYLKFMFRSQNAFRIKSIGTHFLKMIRI